MRFVVLGLLGLAYVAATHWLMTDAPSSPWNAVGVLAPMLAAVALGAWKAGRHWRGALAAAAIAALCAQALLGVQVAPPLLYLGQHVAINAMLGCWFASTLRPGAQPLISTLAQRVHGHLTPAMAAYTRKVTSAWVAYFGAMVAVSLALYGLAPFAAWAVFANLLTPLALAAMFVGERLLRFRLHPEFERASMLDTIRAYRHRG